MMLNELPRGATLDQIADFLATSHRYALRNRCLYRLRPVMRYKDIVALRLGSVLRGDGTLVDRITLQDYSVVISGRLAADLEAFIDWRWPHASSVRNYVFARGSEHLFKTQRSACFSANWLAQLYTHLDRAVHAQDCLCPISL